MQNGGINETVAILYYNNTVGPVFGQIETTTITGSGFYYTTVPTSLPAASGNGGTLALIYVAGDSAYKANSFYYVGANGLSGGDLANGTLIVDGGSKVVLQNYLDSILRGGYSQGLLASTDMIYDNSTGTITGDLLAANFTPDQLSATGSITINNPGDVVIAATEQVSAGKNITITAGGNFIFSPDSANSTHLTAGGDITLVGGTGFVNYSGSNAIKAGGRWLIYAPNPLIYPSNTALYYSARYNNAWDIAKFIKTSDELIYDGRGGLTGDFTLWGTAYDPNSTPAATGSGFIFSSADPTTLPLTPTQLQRKEAITAAHVGREQRWEPVDAGNLPLTIVDGGVAVE